MSSAFVIVCRTCGSYQTECIARPDVQVARYHCALCGDEFTVDNPRAYVQQHPPDWRRCSRCDKEGVELVERDHRYSGQPAGEVVDLYRCPFCGLKIQMMVRRSPHVLYD